MKFCIFITFLILQIAYGGYPSNFPKCKHGDEPCFIKGAADILKNHISGVADVNLLPIDPFSLKTLNVARNPASPVNVDIKLKDVIVEGFKDIKLEKFQGLKEDLSGRNVIAGSLDSLTIKGKYMLDGNVLVLPIKGDGNSEIKCKNIKFDFSWDFKKVEKDGKIYAALEHVKLQFEPDNVHFFFDHLFDGDAALQASTNDFLNANWSEIFHEIQPGLSKALGLVFKSYIGKFFAHQPYAEYFQ
ncbi:circadian clock-controlled protein daywake-like [Musca domestica]|uniref:Circadian clock-controlled protein daywake-like n=1 Tax=Musca domestica TaxID=7370 RepID=A0ABM3URV4_MUSDO|nr:circadian clock-controlled protein daywake-like [Musca domestica]